MNGTEVRKTTGCAKRVTESGAAIFDAGIPEAGRLARRSRSAAVSISFPNPFYRVALLHRDGGRRKTVAAAADLDRKCRGAGRDEEKEKGARCGDCAKIVRARIHDLFGSRPSSPVRAFEATGER